MKVPEAELRALETGSARRYECAYHHVFLNRYHSFTRSQVRPPLMCMSGRYYGCEQGHEVTGHYQCSELSGQARML